MTKESQEIARWRKFLKRKKWDDEKSAMDDELLVRKMKRLAQLRKEFANEQKKARKA
jgi:hypothetical protein